MPAEFVSILSGASPATPLPTEPAARAAIVFKRVKQAGNTQNSRIEKRFDHAIGVS